jgi:hypothetical protein
MFKRLKLDWRFTLQEEIFLFTSLMLLTSYFLSWRIAGDIERSPWNLLFVSEVPAVSYFLSLLVVLVLITPLSVQMPRLRPWLGIATALTVNAALILTAFFGQSTFGADLARLLALVLLFLSANPAIVKAGDIAMRRLNRQNAEVFTHWGTVLPGIQFPAQDFYQKLEDNIRARQWPGVEMLRLHHSEAGLLSHNREYLRVIRQRQVVDICAANFGKDYFFTLREAEIQAQLTLMTVVIFLLTLFLLFSWMWSSFGFFAGSITFGLLLVAGVLLLFNVLRLGLTRLDGLLLRMPLIGPIYETFFRRSTTYFQHDTRMVFLKMMDDLMKEHVDEETSAKGVKLLPCFEHQPILDGLYKSSVRETARGETK